MPITLSESILPAVFLLPSYAMLRHAIYSAVLISLGCLNLTATAGEPNLDELLRRSKRTLFLGDSITASAGYIVNFEAWIAASRRENPPHIIDGGLSSETVSGLSEEGHAGGKFPRPDLAERLDRVLALAKPDLVFACYGINCGIYQPFDEARFAKYQAGWRHLKSSVEKQGGTLVVITPPFYDDLRARRTDSYNAVLDRYAAWLVDQRKEGWHVLDLHTDMTRAVAEYRKSDPMFTFQPDAVHPNDAGHWFIARRLIQACGDARAAEANTPQEMLKTLNAPEKTLELVRKRTHLLRDAYVGAAGHKRPGVAKGLPIEEAEAKSREISAEIAALLKKPQ